MKISLPEQLSQLEADLESRIMRRLESEATALGETVIEAELETQSKEIFESCLEADDEPGAGLAEALGKIVALEGRIHQLEMDLAEEESLAGWDDITIKEQEKSIRYLTAQVDRNWQAVVSVRESRDSFKSASEEIQRSLDIVNADLKLERLKTGRPEQELRQTKNALTEQATAWVKASEENIGLREERNKLRRPQA